MLSIALTFVFQGYTVGSVCSQSHQVHCSALVSEVVWIGFQHTHNDIICMFSGLEPPLPCGSVTGSPGSELSCFTLCAPWHQGAVPHVLSWLCVDEAVN